MEVLPDNNVENGKTNAIISYLWIPGVIIAWILNNSKKNSFASFHIRQMIGLTVLSILNGWVIYKFFGKFAGGIVGLILFVLWIIGFMGALKGEKKLVPIVGEQFQEWFKNIG